MGQDTLKWNESNRPSKWPANARNRTRERLLLHSRGRIIFRTIEVESTHFREFASIDRLHCLWNRCSTILSGYRTSFSSLFDRFNRRPPRNASALRLCLLLPVVYRDEANIELVLTNARRGGGRGEGEAGIDGRTERRKFIIRRSI